MLSVRPSRPAAVWLRRDGTEYRCSVLPGTSGTSWVERTRAGVSLDRRADGGQFDVKRANSKTMNKMTPTSHSGMGRSAEGYRHPEATAALRPDVGTQAQFRKKKDPVDYQYDSSLSPALEWDGQNPAREQAEAKIAALQDGIARLEAMVDSGELSGSGLATAKEALAKSREDAASLQALSKPFLNWAGKAERLSFEVPTLPLFVHERLSTAAILETLKGHSRDRQPSLFDLFGESELPIHDKLLKAYEHQDGWVNRLILGDSLVVMNSLIGYEGLGGQVQTIYVDPPYAVKFGSNFQPFVRRRDVTHGADEDMVREPEMVQAYRDTWELGIHSFLTYLRDRLLLARELLHPSGSIFVQMSDTNLHHVRELMDEVFGAECFVSQISFQTTSGTTTRTLATLGDFLLWYAKDPERLKVRKLFEEQPLTVGEGNAKWVLLPDGSYRGVTAAEKRGEAHLPDGARLYKPSDLQSQGAPSNRQPFSFEGKVYEPANNRHWSPTYPEGLERLADAGRIHVAANSLQYRRFATDFPYTERGNLWTDTLTGSFTDAKRYVVQTNTKVIERCLLMTSDPGDLVFDPTCGSGTTAWCAEKWGRRWITCDTSRVPIALARQRLLTSAFEFYSLNEPERGPAGGFKYQRKQNNKGEEVGGIVPHITLKSIARNEPAKEQVLFDRPEKDVNVTRVCGPFCIEATIPTPVDWDGDGEEDSGDATSVENYADHVERMIEVLRRSPVLRVGGGQQVALSKVRHPAQTMSLSAEASVGGDEKQPVAIVFGPENGAVAEKLVFEAAREAHAKSYSHLYVIGFAIQPDARRMIENCERAVSVPATWVQASMDLVMGDLLKNLRSSQVFAVCGLPDVRIERTEDGDYRVELLGYDVFDPVDMESNHRDGTDVPAWFLDTDYNGMCFHVCQAFFPRTSAWEGLKRSLRGEFNESVWPHLSGTISVPFSAGEHGQIAVKAVDDRGNELTVVKPLTEAEAEA